MKFKAFGLQGISVERQHQSNRKVFVVAADDGYVSFDEGSQQCVGDGDLIDSDFKKGDTRVRVKEMVLNVKYILMGLLLQEQLQEWAH